MGKPNSYSLLLANMLYVPLDSLATSLCEKLINDFLFLCLLIGCNQQETPLGELVH